MGRAQPDHGDAAARPPLRDGMYRCQLPAWALSLTIHFLGLLTIVAISSPIPHGVAEEPARTAGIALVGASAGPPQYYSEADAGGAATTANATKTLPSLDPTQSQSLHANAAADLDSRAGESAATSSAHHVANELVGLLPQASESSVAGGGALPAATELAGQMTAGARNTSLGPEHRYAQTGVFGVVGKGTKFVYVFDRSGSMASFAGRPLAAAKRELLASLQDLDSLHQFQIIFYNERPTIFNPVANLQPKMLFGGESEKKTAADFINSIVADGGTRHLDALRLALRMKPDVIFFLTDADEPTLTRAELEEIRKLNDRIGCSIHAIEFGTGPRRSSDSFLVEIARQNSGNHVYVDLMKLSAE